MKVKSANFAVLRILVPSIFGSFGCKKPEFDFAGLPGKVLADVEAVHDCLLAHSKDEVVDEKMDRAATLRRLLQKCQADLGSMKTLRVLNDGNVIDYWGNALHVEISESGELRFRVWSRGPNGLDEGGRGDDILSRRSESRGSNE
jgi:hypothetical protein